MLGHSVANTAVRPLFYDALSGEFRAPINRWQLRTLGRLFVACYKEGVIMDKESNPTLTVMEHTPEWGGGVRARINLSRLSGVPMLSSLTLISAADDRVRLGVANKVERDLATLYTPDGGSQQFDLGLDDEFYRARIEITAEAQAFFSQKR
jgi:hypothetical protein